MTGKQARITEIERRLRKLEKNFAVDDTAMRILRQEIYFGGFTDEPIIKIPSPPVPSPAATVTLKGCGQLVAPGLTVDFYNGGSLVDSQTTDGSGIATSTAAGITLATVNATGWTGSVAASNGSSSTLQGANATGYTCIGNTWAYPYQYTSLTITDPTSTATFSSSAQACIDTNGNLNNYLPGPNTCLGGTTGNYPIVYQINGQIMNQAGDSTTFGASVFACTATIGPAAVHPAAGYSCASLPSSFNQTGGAGITSISHSPLVVTMTVGGGGNTIIWQTTGGTPTITINGP